MFLAGTGLVGISALVAGLAPNFEVLLVGRLLMGAGAAASGPTGLALLNALFEGERRQRAFGLYSTVTGLGAAAGMVLGGALTWAGDWRWSLLVNAPLALAIALLALRVLGLRAERAKRHALGLPSTVLVTTSLAALIYGLSRAADRGWADAATIVALLAFVALFAALLAVDSRAPEPLLPARVFANRDRIIGFVNLALSAAALTAFVVYLNQYMQAVLGFNPLQAGLGILPFGLAILVTTQVLATHLGRLGLKARALLGLLLMLAAFGWLSRLDATGDYASGVLPQIILLGLGIGLAIVPFNLIVMATTPPRDAGITAGLLQSQLVAGGSIGVALLLIPFTDDAAGPAQNISAVFLWAAGGVTLELLVSVPFWLGRTTRNHAGEADPTTP
ncbi:MFS transporter [Pseudonocardia acaciae]|uniref:MFS transporter n=1 Tax=Pseudonocardia acaciae TaxID=551276 RepID=UPI000684ED4C|nr:MFS transporter [Pseudonocardia acaciae]